MKRIVAAMVVLLFLAPSSTALAWFDHNGWCNVCRSSQRFVTIGEFDSDEQNHYPLYECTNCMSYISLTHFEYAPHEGGTATCTEKAVCTVCGKPYGETLGHEWSATVSKVANALHGYVCTRGCGAVKDIALCSLVDTWDWSGPTAPSFFLQCSICDTRSLFTNLNCVSDVIAATCASPEKDVCTITVDVATSQGDLHFQSSNTEIVGEPLGHNWKRVETVARTCTKNGYTLCECARCGLTQEIGFRKALGHYYGEWTFDGGSAHSAACLRCAVIASRDCDCEEGEICPVCGSGEYVLIKESTAVGDALPKRGELCVRYAPEKGFLISWEYFGQTEPFVAPLTISIPVAIEGGFFVADTDYVYENGVLTLTVDEQAMLEMIR